MKSDLDQTNESGRDENYTPSQKIPAELEPRRVLIECRQAPTIGAGAKSVRLALITIERTALAIKTITLYKNQNQKSSNLTVKNRDQT